MDYDVTSKDSLLPSSQVRSDPNNTIADQYILLPNSRNACNSCPFHQDYYKALTEHGYWKALHEKAKEKIAELEKENKELKAKLRMREKQLFGKKSEKGQQGKKQADSNKEEKQKRNRGQQPGKPGHGRGKHERLEVIEKTIEIPEEERYCEICGLAYEDFPGTEDSEDIVVNVKAHKRRIKRKRYKKTANVHKHQE